jgi:hypothetical protein
MGSQWRVLSRGNSLPRRLQAVKRQGQAHFNRHNSGKSWVWWYTTVIPVQEAKAVGGQIELHSEFIQGQSGLYNVARPVSKKKKKKRIW